MTAKTTSQEGREAAKGTLVDGLIAAAIFGATTGALDVLNAGDFTWRTVGIAALTGGLMAVLAFLRHAYAAPYLRIRRLSKPKRR
jgi:hypothetical protein